MTAGPPVVRPYWKKVVQPGGKENGRLARVSPEPVRPAAADDAAGRSNTGRTGRATTAAARSSDDAPVTIEMMEKETPKFCCRGRKGKRRTVSEEAGWDRRGRSEATNEQSPTARQRLRVAELCEPVLVRCVGHDGIKGERESWSCRGGGEKGEVGGSKAKRVSRAKRRQRRRRAVSHRAIRLGIAAEGDSDRLGARPSGSTCARGDDWRRRRCVGKEAAESSRAGRTRGLGVARRAAAGRGRRRGGAKTES